jgi:uncharacterized protein (DUF2252 family)
VRDPIDEFMRFNRPFARRNPELLRLKVARMAEGPFAFFRGTFHLFARDVIESKAGPLPLFGGGGAELELVGDIHSENFGTYKAADGAIHYDVNDFDETTTGRFDFDVCRLATSWLLAAHERKDPLEQAVPVPLAGLVTYADTVRRLLKKGRGPQLDVSEATPSGCAPVDELIVAGAAAKRPAFIGRLTEWKNGGRRLLRSTHYFNLPDEERARAERLLADYRKRAPRGSEDAYFKVEDVCGRVAGIGSMGRHRYAVLIAGKGSADARNVILEFKESRPSAYDLYRNRDTDEAALATRAQKVVQVQQESQAAASEFLGYAVDGGLSFQAREIGPPDARVDSKSLKSAALLAGVARVQATVLARIHARAATRAVGSANPLAELEAPDAFCQRVLAFALGYADVATRDWTRFVGARAQIDDVASWAGASSGPVTAPGT